MSPSRSGSGTQLVAIIRVLYQRLRQPARGICCPQSLVFGTCVRNVPKSSKKPTQPSSGCGAERRAAVRSCKNLLIDRWSGVITHGEGDEHAEIIGVGRQLEAFPEDYPLPPICAPGRSFTLAMPFLSSAVCCFARITAPRSFGHRWSIPCFAGGGRGADGALLGVQSPPSWVRMPWDAWQGFPGKSTLRRLIWGRFGDFCVSPARQGHFQACLDYTTFKRSLPTAAIR